MPSHPYVTVGGEDEVLVLDHHEDYDRKVVQTTDGRVAMANGEPINQIDEDPDLAVIKEDPDGDTVESVNELVVSDREVDDDDPPIVQTSAGNDVVVGSEPVVYEASADLDFAIRNVENVSEGENLNVDVRITNSDWGKASVNATFRLPHPRNDSDIVSNTEQIEIEGNSETEHSFQYTTETGDYVADQVVVEVGGMTASRDIKIEGAGAAVSITEANAPIVEGSKLTLTTEINRYGSIPSGSQMYPISFFVDGTEQQTVVRSLSPGSSTTETFSYETSSEDPPEIEARVASRTSTSTADIRVISRDEFEDNIEVNITNTSVGGLNDELEVNATFEYDGEIPQGDVEFPANLTVDGTVVDQRNISFAEPAPITETFVYNRTATDPPTATVAVETPSEDDAVEFERSDDIRFETVTDPAARNESLSTTVVVENTGETPGQKTLTVAVSAPAAVESNATREYTVQLEPSESTSRDVTFDLTDNVPPRLDLRANTSDANETRTIEVRDNTPTFTIETATVEEASNSSELSVTSTIRNTGGVTGTQEVQLTFDDEAVHTTSLTLEPDEERTLSATVYPPADGTYAYGTVTGDDSVSDTITADGTTQSEPDESGGQLSLDGLALPFLVVSLLGVVLVSSVVVKRRTDLDDLQELQERMTALQPAARKLQTAARNARNLISNGGTGTVVVQNGLPRTVLVRIRVRSGNEILFLEDFELAESEQRTLECLPDADQFEVGSGVDDIAAHEETFQRGTDEVGIVLQPDGITIAEL